MGVVLYVNSTEFLRQVWLAPRGTVYVRVADEQVMLHVSNGPEDNEIRHVFTAEGPECIGPGRWSLFKGDLKDLLSRPDVSNRIVLIDENRVIENAYPDSK